MLFGPSPSPFQSSHQVVRSPSQATSYYDFSWTPDTASFLVAASHVAFDGNGGTRSASTGNIYLTPSVDLLLTATGTYAYDLPGWDMDVRYAFVAYDGSFGSRFSQSLGDFTFKGPTSGNFTISKSGILPAGEVSILNYTIYVDGFDSTGLLATGSGDILFTLQPVPEPSTIVLVIATTLLSRRRSRIRIRCNNS
ncbi:MAG: PEP-CTERM sorting domain-containing protein [Planctomycetia bacterium]|nr:PEP-CTERM sorting domain-containing protein [Planctomycetia bacterium]